MRSFWKDPLDRSKAVEEIKEQEFWKMDAYGDMFGDHLANGLGHTAGTLTIWHDVSCQIVVAIASGNIIDNYFEYHRGFI